MASKFDGGIQPLIDPRLVDITLQSSGRQSIDSTLFDQHRPLALHLAVPIVDVLKASSRPPEQAIPDYKQSGSTLEVGPGVFAARQKVVFSLLVDGQPEFSVTSHLAGVSIRRQVSADQMGRRFIYVTLAATIAAVGIYTGYAQLTSHQTTAACHPFTNEGNCYEPGEFCPDKEHGAQGVAGDGEKIVCKNSDGWRWESA
jgi:hypothetical protein